MTRSRAQRAVTDSQKSERRSEILAAAEAHLRAVGLEGFSMEFLAQQLGLARGTLYRYFATREEVLLALYAVQRAAWADELIDAVRPGMSDEEFVQCFLDRTRADPLLLKLRARLESVIEHNVPEARLIESKLLMQELVARVSGHVAVCLRLDEENARDLLMAFISLLLGASQMDTAPALDIRKLPAAIQKTLKSMSGERIFRNNAVLILEGVRRRAKGQGSRPAAR